MDKDLLAYEAKSFYNAYIALEQLSHNQNEELIYTIPMIVNGALAIELTLKSILVCFEIDYKKEHNLLNLFSLLPDRVRKIIWMYLTIKAPEYENPKRRIEELSLISNVFVNWRYVYEGKKLPACDLGFLSIFANAAMYIMLGIGNNVNLVKTTIDINNEEIVNLIEQTRAEYINKQKSLHSNTIGGEFA